MLTSSCAATIPAAWCTTYWKSAPDSSAAAERARRRVRLQHEDRLRGDVGGDQGVGVLVDGETTRPG